MNLLERCPECEMFNVNCRCNEVVLPFQLDPDYNYVFGNRGALNIWTLQNRDQVDNFTGTTARIRTETNGVQTFYWRRYEGPTVGMPGYWSENPT